MARRATIQKAETWVYIDDEERQVLVDEKKPRGKKTKVLVPIVKEIAAGKTPPGGGSVFMIRPVPHDLYLEVQLYGSDDANVAKLKSGKVPSELLAQIVEAVVGGWKWVENGDGGEIDFAGPESTALLDPEVKTVLGNYVMARSNEEKKKRGKRPPRSGATRS